MNGYHREGIKPLTTLADIPAPPPGRRAVVACPPADEELWRSVADTQGVAVCVVGLPGVPDDEAFWWFATAPGTPRPIHSRSPHDQPP